jgi:hypothetical protein
MTAKQFVYYFYVFHGGWICSEFKRVLTIIRIGDDNVGTTKHGCSAIELAAGAKACGLLNRHGFRVYSGSSRSLERSSKLHSPTWNDLPNSYLSVAASELI